ncbi:MAG TPA: HAD-IIA family hydrolase [Thermoproteota archaeon]|nr:HAD-IIA family hydrolase [Thermoproteota archaeon]
MNFKAVVLDLDGVIYRGNTVIPGSAEAVADLQQAGKKVRFLTNNATKTSEEYSEKLSHMDINAEPSHILTSGIATAMYIRKTLGLQLAYVVGSGSLRSEMTKEGVRLTDWDSAEVVVTSLDPEFTYQKLFSAMKAVRRGCPLVATNMDPVVPDENGFVPGAGSITSAVEVASGATATYIGKPSSLILQIAETTWGLDRASTCIVGDRLDTDMVAGNSFGWRPILVLSGSTGPSDLLVGLPDSSKPSATYQNLREFVSTELEARQVDKRKVTR